MVTEIFKIDASWAEKLTKTRVQFLLTPTVLTFNVNFAFLAWKEKRIFSRSPNTVGAIFFENQNACLKSPRMHQSSKSLRPSSRVGPEVSKTPPTCKVWMILCQVMTI